MTFDTVKRKYLNNDIFGDIHLNLDGLDFLKQTKSKVNRIFWTIICTGALTAAIYFCYTYCDEYFNKKIIVSETQKLFKQNITLPTITLCSPQSFRKDNVLNYYELHKILNHLDEINKFTDRPYYDRIDIGRNLTYSFLREKGFQDEKIAIGIIFMTVLTQCLESLEDTVIILRTFIYFLTQYDDLYSANADFTAKLSRINLCMKSVYYDKWFDLMKKSYDEIAYSSISMPFNDAIIVLFETLYGRPTSENAEELVEVRNYFHVLMMHEAMNYEEKMILSSYLEKINLKKILENHGWKLEDNLVSCQIGSVACNSTSFNKIFTSFGICYQLNSDIPQSIPDYDGGISIILNSETYNQYDQIIIGSGVNGINLVVHSSDEPPAPTFRGITLEPGMRSNVEIKKFTTTLLDKRKGGNCDESIDIPLFDKFTIFGCTLNCLFFNIENECDCLAYNDPRIITENHYMNKSCRTFDELRCFLDVKTGRKKSKICNECFTPPCHFDDYLPKITTEQLPQSVVSDYIHQSELRCSLNHNMTLSPTIYKKSPENISDNACLTTLNWKENLISMNIFYGELSELKSVQKPKYTTIDFIGIIGGFTGLYAGISFISIIQFFGAIITISIRLIKLITTSNSKIPPEH
ncbi:hypothetical protein SNEBB_010302 [Seison nebaliae]|nr:hypothetical protein SNEBB_010302 [Seison nebaliae]